MRRKNLLFFFPILLFLLAATNLQTIRVGIYHNPPLAFMDGDQPRGFFVDVLERIAEEEGWQLEYHLCEWEACLQALDNGEIDLLGPIAYSEERVKRFDFSGETMITNWGQVYVQSGETDISILDLEGKKIGLLHGDIHTNAFIFITEEFSIEFEPIYFDSYADIFAAIDDGRVYGGVLNHLYTLQHVVEDAEKTSIIFNPIEVRFAAPKNKNTALLNDLDAQLAALKADKNSLYYHSMNFWAENEYADRAPIEPWFWWLLGGTLFLLLSLLGVNYLLRKEVRRQTNALRSSREELALIMDSIPSMISFIDPEQRYLYVDEGYANWYGFKKEDVVGKRIDEILPPAIYAKVRPRLEEMLTTGNEVHYSHRVMRRDGQTADVAISYLPKIDENGKVEAFFATVRDITEEKKVEIALRESEEKYRQLIDNSLVGIFIADIEADEVKFANDGIITLFGYDNVEEITGLSLSSFIAPRDMAQALKRWQERQKGKKYKSQYTLKALRKDGSVFDAEFVSQIIQYHGKEAVQGMVIDISERVEAEARFRRLSEASYEAIFISERGACLEQNSAAERLFGYTQEEAVGRIGTEWIAPEDRELVMHHMLSGYEEPYRVSGLRKDGTTFPAEIRGRMMEYAGRKVRVTVLRDISEQVSAEDGLRESKERFERVVARVPFPILITDTNGDISFYNDKAIEVFGYTLADIQLATAWWQRVYPDPEYRQHVQNAWGKAIALADERGEQIETQVWDMVRKDGEVRTVEFDMMPLGDISVIAMNDITEQVEAENKLRESKERFEKIIAKAPIPMGIVNVEGEPDSYNERFVEVFGYQSHEVQDWWPTMYPDKAYQAKVKESWEKAVDLAKKTEGQLQTQTWDVVRKDGQSRTVQFDMVPLAGLLVVVMNDITDLLQTTSDLRDREKKLREAQEIGKMGHWEFDLQTDELIWSNQVCRIFNVDPETFTPTHSAFLEAVHPEDRDMVRNLYVDSIENKTDYEIRTRILLENGEVRHIHDRCKTEYAEDGTPLRSIGTLQDITERALAEQGLQENEQRLRTLINATPDIICFKDGEGRWLTANNADLALFELSDVDYVGKKDSELAEYSDFYRDAFLTCEDSDEFAWQAGGLSRADEVIPTPNDGDKVFDVIKVPLFKEDGTREALVVLGRDITKQVTAQTQLQHHARQLEIVNAITVALSTSLSLDELLKTILHQVVQVIPCDSASIFLAKDEEQLYIVHAIGDAKRFMGHSFKKDDTLMKKILPEEKVLIIDDVMNDPAFSLWDSSTSFRGWMGLPLHARGLLVGYLTFDSIEPQAFSASQASLAVAFATQVAQALYNAQLHERVIADANDLEQRVQKRTGELQRFVDLTAGREIRMIELKDMIRELRRQLVRAGHVPIVGDSLDIE